jgi:rhodanese-related sulfurtransferase
MSSGWQNDYAEDVTAKQAYDLLEQEAKAQLVDVRTKAEWSFVGVADLSPLGKEAILAEWQCYPAMEVAPDFVAGLERELESRGVGRDDPVLFLCRSGARSLSAARALTAAGWRGCRNVSGGFEGPMDANRHRGGTDGWKAAGLPWIQS